MSKAGFNLDMSGITKGLNSLDKKVATATKLYAETAKEKLVSESKINATWVDRTGLSRQTIDGSVEIDETKAVIETRGNTPQFKYLELCHEKKYATLWPTIEKNMQSVLEGWSKVVFK